MAKSADKSNVLATNFFFSGISEVSIGFLFLLLILSARLLGDEQFGVFSFAMAYVNIFGFMMHGGFRFVYTRVVSRDHELAEKYMGNIMSLQMLTSLLGIVVIVLTILLTDKTGATLTVVYVLGAAEIFRFFKYTYRFAFEVENRYDLEAATVLFERISLLAAGLGVLVLGYGVVGFAWAFFFSRLVDLLITLLVMRRFVYRPSFRFDFSLWPQLVGQGLPFMLNAMAALLLYRVDSVLLSFMRSDEEVGWYSAAYRLMEGMYLFPKIVSAVLYPQLSRLYDDRPALMALYRRGIKYVLFVAIPLTVVGFVMADQVTLLVYGAEFANAIPALQVLLVSLSFIFIHEVSVTLLASIDRQVVSFYTSVMAVITNVILNLMLIPRLGIVGSGIATVAAELSFCLAVWIYLERHRYHISYVALAIKPLLAALIVAVVAYAFIDDFFVRVAFVVPSYLLLVTLMAFWDEKERALFRGMLRRAETYAIKAKRQVFGTREA